MIEIMTILTLIAMLTSLFLIVIPVVPVTTLEWGLVMLYGILTHSMGDPRLSVLSMVVASVWMLLGTTSGMWMPLLGLKGRQISPLGLFGFFIGAIIGGFVIPIPILGNMVGAVIGVFIFEYAKLRELKEAFSSGGAALKLYVYGMIAEFVFSILILITFIVGILTV
ncbi:hypothetical protein MASR2M15_05690 [Anaerolineales bacterium]